MTDVVLFHDADCPNVQPTREALREAFDRVRAAPTWREVTRDDPELPEDWRSLGSPSVLVDGRDVAGTDDEPCEGGSCRLYVTDSGKLAGVPPVDAIARALAATSSRASGFVMKMTAAGVVVAALGASASVADERLPAADLVPSRAAWFLWRIPSLGLFVGAFLPPVPRALLWGGCLTVMGVACLANARRCRRTHCFITGPLFLVGVGVAAAHGAGLVSFAWFWLPVVVGLGTVGAYGYEAIRGRYRGAVSGACGGSC